MSTSKRRLSLLPEVLPAPARPDPTSVRERTLARLKFLAAIGAASLAAGCGKVEGDNGTNGGSSGTPNDGGKTGDDGGYGVVDPLPPPSCFGFDLPTGKAEFVDDGDGGVDAGDLDAGDLDASAGARLLDLTLTFSQNGVVLTGIPTTDLPVVDKSNGTNTLKIRLRVPKTTGKVAKLRLAFSCERGPSQLAIQLTFRTDGVEVTVTDH